MASRGREWSTLRGIVDGLRHRWALGTWIKPYAAGSEYSPVTVPVRGPTTDDLGERPSEVAAWVTRFQAEAARQPRLIVATKLLRSRALGVNEIPARVTIPTLGDLVEVVDGVDDLRALDAAIQLARAELPAAESWVRANPMTVLKTHSDWERVIAAARWVVDSDVSQLDLRHIDAPGVDSKFVEANRRVLRPLLDAVLPPERIVASANDLNQRYRMRPRPRFVRFRTLGNDVGLADGFSELEVRIDEIALRPLPVRSVIVVENRATFNALPDVPDAIAVFGGGYAVTVLEEIGWLVDREIRYWGDIDTHGFRILDRLRQRFGHVRSMLMDEPTLVANLDRVVTEAAPLSEVLVHLTAPEQRLYRDLVEDRFGVAVRLEQERIGLAAIQRALL